MTNIKYLSIIDNILDNYKYQTTEDGYTFIVEKREGLYCFHLIDEEKILQQFFPKEQIEAVGLEYIVKELEYIFINDKSIYY